jgi:phosphoglycolate phosphatase
MPGGDLFEPLRGMPSMMMPTVFFDLDGPLLDVSERYYRVYAFILQEQGFRPIEKERYWELKRQTVPEREILALSRAEQMLDGYIARRLALIESDAFMMFDRLQAQALSVLRRLKQFHSLVLVTLRSRREQLEKQLQRLGLLHLFTVVLSSGEQTKPRWRIKVNLVRTKCSSTIIPGWFIGDTETDILAGRDLGLTTIAVKNGIRAERFLLAAQPHFIIENISNIDKTGIINENSVC